MARSEILIEQEAMYSSGESQVSSQNLSHRVQAIVKTILSNNNIDKILRKYNLMEDGVSKEDQYRAYASFKDSTKLDFENALVVNPNTGREGMVSLGFSIEYENESPDLAYEITKELIDLVITGNQGKITNKENSRLEFLQKEKQTALLQLTEIEAEVSAFNQKNALYLPDVYPITIKRYDDLKSNLDEIDIKIGYLKGSQDDVLANIATTNINTAVFASDGKRISTAAEKLLIMEQEYENLSSQYTANHPDIIRIKSDIAVLKKTTKKERRKGSGRSSGTSNPAQMLLVSRLEGIRDEIEHEKVRKGQTREEIKQLEARIQKMPGVKEAFKLLELKQESAVTKFKEIEEKLVQGGLSINMRKANLLENFILLEPAQYPLSPIKPKKKILLAVLLLLAVSLAYFIALLRDMYNDRISGKDVLIRFVDKPVFVIPNKRKFVRVN